MIVTPRQVRQRSHRTGFGTQTRVPNNLYAPERSSIGHRTKESPFPSISVHGCTVGKGQLVFLSWSTHTSWTPKSQYTPIPLSNAPGHQQWFKKLYLHTHVCFISYPLFGTTRHTPFLFKYLKLFIYATSSLLDERQKKRIIKTSRKEVNISHQLKFLPKY